MGEVETTVDAGIGFLKPSRFELTTTFHAKIVIENFCVDYQKIIIFFCTGNGLYCLVRDVTTHDNLYLPPQGA